ncbi:MAG: hypothetical protein KAS32_08630 [Candidatus Peribacteraceae bacterium]|nr:hypothetical protein [Candidatus Peribacteraceae bacterium]
MRCEYYRKRYKGQLNTAVGIILRRSPWLTSPQITEKINHHGHYKPTSADAVRKTIKWRTRKRAIKCPRCNHIEWPATNQA